MSLRLLLDEDINPAVAKGLRNVGVDALSVHELGRAGRGVSDEDQLAFAASEGRAIVTYNRADFQALDAVWRLREQEHSGILWCSERLIPRRAVGDLIRALLYLAQEQPSLVGLCLPATPRPR